jgi:hypothetical protein
MLRFLRACVRGEHDSSSRDQAAEYFCWIVHAFPLF